MLAQRSNQSDKSRARRISRTNSKPNIMNGLDDIGEPECKRIKVEGAAVFNIKCEEASSLPGQGESVPDGTGSWGDVSLSWSIYIYFLPCDILYAY